MPTTFDNYLHNLANQESVMPAILDEKNLLVALNAFLWTNFDTLENIKNSANNISFYDIPEWKKEFNITTVRQIIQDISLKPYSGKQVFVLENFDTANNAAQNSALKIIEEYPPYAIILIGVSNPGNILPTIHSRTLNFFQNHSEENLDSETILLLEKFISGEKTEWLTHLYKNNYSQSEAISILTKVFFSLNFEQQNKCKFFIESLSKTNEKPKNILEAFFLWEVFFK